MLSAFWPGPPAPTPGTRSTSGSAISSVSASAPPTSSSAAQTLADETVADQSLEQTTKRMMSGIFCTLLGQLVLSFATILYMSPALGCGPRDTLMVILGKKLPKLPIGAVKFGIEALVLVIGILLGAPFGVGTVLVMALQAGIFQFVCKLCRFEPRSLSHESILDTFRRVNSR